MKIGYHLLIYSLTLLLLSACSDGPKTGPGKVRFDRDTCERCIMAISDPNFAAQIRGGPAGEKQKLYKFDDLGCAVIWLDQQQWKDNPAIEIWVSDYHNGEWIDARKAHYIKNQLTPMNYGLGAQPENAPEALDFRQAREHIYSIEAQYNLHGGAIHLRNTAATSTATSTPFAAPTSTPATDH